MPRVSTPNTAEVEVRCTQDGQQVENVLHFVGSGNYNESELNLLANDVATWWIASLQSITGNTVTLNSIVATDLSSPTGPQVTFTTGLPQTGTEGAAALPNNVTVAVKLLTASRGRSFRGRVYFIGLGEDATDGSTLHDAAVTGIKAAFEALRDYPFSSNDSAWGVLSEVTAGAPRTEGICTPITTVSVDATVDSQRRRLPGRGR